MRRRQPIPGGDINGYFVIERVPAGEAPAELRQKWVGLVLPLRYDRKANKRSPYRGMGAETKQLVHGDDGVWIVGRDAIAALDRAGHSDAAAYWDVKFAQLPPTLIFDSSDGRLITAGDAEAIDPGIGAAFDA